MKGERALLIVSLRHAELATTDRRERSSLMGLMVFYFLFCVLTFESSPLPFSALRMSSPVESRSETSPHAVVIHVAAASSAPSPTPAAAPSSSSTKQVATFAVLDDSTSEPPAPPAYDEAKSAAPPAYTPPDPASPWAAAAAVAPAAPPDEPPMDLDELARSLDYPLLRLDAQAQLHLQSRPSCLMICYMMPLPLWFGGCCISRSNDMTFNEEARTIRIISWPGAFCCGCCKKERALRYADVMSLIATPHDLRLNGEQAWLMQLVIAGGERVRISDPIGQRELERRAFALHRFLFGRARPRAYQQPTINDIIVMD